MPELHARSVYTIVAPEKLLSAARGALPSLPLAEGRRWVSARGALMEAKKTGRRLPVVFADARATAQVEYAALLHDIKISEDGTQYRFTHLRQLKGQPKTTLRLAGTGKRLPSGFIRPYAMVRTPSSLRKDQWPDLAPALRELEDRRRAFLVHVNPNKGWSYERGFDPRDPLGCASFMLASPGEHVWSAGNCWRLIRDGDLLLFKFNGGRKKEPAGVYFAGQVIRPPFTTRGGRRLRFAVDAHLTVSGDSRN